MTPHEFHAEMLVKLANFKINMINHPNTPNYSSEEWMDMFLRWCEWKTDEHAIYWSEE